MEQDWGFGIWNLEFGIHPIHTSRFRMNEIGDLMLISQAPIKLLQFVKVIIKYFNNSDWILNVNWNLLEMLI